MSVYRTTGPLVSSSITKYPSVEKVTIFFVAHSDYCLSFAVTCLSFAVAFVIGSEYYLSFAVTYLSFAVTIISSPEPKTHR